MKIALVDDMTDIRNEMRQILKDFSSDNHVTFEIDEFNSGEDLLSDYTAYTYDIIFMDVYMDSMTGIETAQKLRQNDCRTIIIFLTSSEEHIFFKIRVLSSVFSVKSEKISSFESFSIISDLNSMIYSLHVLFP